MFRPAGQLINFLLFHQEEKQRLAAKEKAAKELEAAKQREAAAKQVQLEEKDDL